ncbi:MAG: aspartate/glutamate racemase family protein [Chloroflexi bacterium]|nr:aspartate/glutamate racemase family protein [Chloroflexota bacterium]
MQLEKLQRIGLIVPSSNTVMEPDFYRRLPVDITLHTARMFLEDVTAEAEARMLDEFTLPAARDLATVQPDVVIFGCTSAGALRGNQFEEDFIKEISRVSGAPTIGVNQSVRETLKKLGAHKIVVVTPYLDELNQHIQSSLEQAGLEILNILGLGIRENTSIAKVPGQSIMELARNAVGDLQPDALFVSCTNFPAVDVLNRLRGLFTFPVISSNQAVLDRALGELAK